MRILLTNDDGIHAEGLKVLEQIARKLSDDVWVVAPEEDQSGVSHSLTISDPLRLRQIDEKHYALKGTPTDCVIMAVKHIMPEAPDLVLSGVNAGGNLADDVSYSGTVSGAVEGMMQGIRSIALSQEFLHETNRDNIPWNTVLSLAPDILKKLVKIPLPEGVLLNVNFPACEAREVTGLSVAPLGHRGHKILIDKRADGRGLPYYWMYFSRGKGENKEKTDIDVLQDKAISVTPMKLDLTAHDFLHSLEKALGSA
ncbi:5'/3'-nucleotidase SurE [Bartonella choladocola]|uniref:5'-nucleotidase SurE n=1 Tax=Bartonella choladocola TaxID=2750995 RepID=A0A1U9MH29_9HYPH|nr:5'/3'-nucleotidase SurE [Bartonella choladocola]AQT47033.1 5'-nucleotidase /3'-nucleotidase /exopolyphosphatase [Bartonella choladocola]